MVGLQNWYFKEYLSGIKSEMEYKMLFSRPEESLLAAWAC
jgi:hypothetical protein